MSNNPVYDWYIKSKQWEEKRAVRLRIDNYRCAMCGKPFDLHVHHILYSNLGFENVETELVTLCKECHKRVHDFQGTPIEAPINQKIKTAASISLSKYINRITLEFCKDYAHTDTEDSNLCSLDTLREMLPKYYLKYGVRAGPELAIARDFLTMFRYEKILSLMKEGAQMDELLSATRYRKATIKKVLNDPERAKRFTKRRRQYADALERYMPDCKRSEQI